MLNFTRGTYLKALCERAYNLLLKNPRFACDEIFPVIDRELVKLKRNSTGYWGITNSDMTYSEMLNRIKLCLTQSNANDFASLIKDIAVQTSDKVKIVFFVQATVSWPSLESFYIACIEDGNFIADLVYVPFAHPNAKEDIDYLKIYRENMELPVVNYDEYSLTAESPDIAVFDSPYDLIPMQFYIDEVDKVVNRSIFIGYGFEITSWNIDAHFRLPLQFKAWRHIVYGEMVKELAARHSYNNGKNVVAWGHPRADYYRNIEAERENIPVEWKSKICNRKVILWNTQHTVVDGVGCGTFFKWKDEVLSYFDNNPDIVLLWRPHPLMFGAIINNRLMTELEVENLIAALERKDNVILDRSPDYRTSFYASDAIITDGSSFLIEYFYMGQPIAYTSREANAIYFYDEICESVYVARERGDISKFIDDIKQGFDPMEEKRTAFGKELLIVNPKGNGEYIKEQIYIELCEELKA